MADPLWLTGASRGINDLAEAIDHIRQAPSPPVNIDHSGRHARLSGQCCRLFRGKNKLDRCIAYDVTKLRRAKECRHGYNDFAGECASELSRDPAKSVWSADADCSGLTLEVSGKRRHAGKEFMAR